MKGIEMSVYFDMFSSWEDVQREFQIKDSEPEVLFAAYEYANYSGDCLVIYQQDGELYLVDASHCSCYGLEGQWHPEETTTDVLRTIVREKEEWGWSDDIEVRHKDAIKAVISKLDGEA